MNNLDSIGVSDLCQYVYCLYCLGQPGSVLKSSRPRNFLSSIVLIFSSYSKVHSLSKIKQWFL